MSDNPIPPTPETSPTPLDYGTASSGLYQGPPPTKDETNMAMLAHLLTIVAGFIAPLIIWLVKKDESKFIEDQAKESLNFQITLLIAYVIGGATSCIFIGLVIFPIAWIIGIILSIMAAMAVTKGEAYRYPFALRLVK